jgi:hypothetical protein
MKIKRQSPQPLPRFSGFKSSNLSVLARQSSRRPIGCRSGSPSKGRLPASSKIPSRIYGARLLGPQRAFHRRLLVAAGAFILAGTAALFQTGVERLERWMVDAGSAAQGASVAKRGVRQNRIMRWPIRHSGGRSGSKGTFRRTQNNRARGPFYVRCLSLIDQFGANGCFATLRWATTWAGVGSPATARAIASIVA